MDRTQPHQRIAALALAAMLSFAARAETQPNVIPPDAADALHQACSAVLYSLKPWVEKADADPRPVRQLRGRTSTNRLEEQAMNTKNIAEAKNRVLAGSLPALKRSAERARQIAAQTGTQLIVAPKGRPASASTVESLKTGRRQSKKPAA